jgi:hypothetical protein
VTRAKVLRTGKAVFDVEFALLHQQREMNFLKAEMGEVKAEVGEVTRMLRLLVKDAAQVCHRVFRVSFASEERQLDGDVC